MRKSSWLMKLGISMALVLAVGMTHRVNMACAAEEVIKLVEAHTGTPENTTYYAAEEFKKRAEKYSNGRIKVEVHPAGAMGSDIKLLQMVKLGTLDIGHTSNGNYASIGRAWMEFDLPYIVHGHYNWFRVMTGPVWEEMQERVKKDGFKLLQAYPAGAERNIMNSKQIVKTPAEAKGIKIRVVASPVNQKLVAKWGFSPVSIAWSETYTSVMQGIVNGVYIPALWAYISKIYEVATYVTETGGIGVWHVVVMNLERYNSLPKDLQAVVDRAATESTLACYEHDQYWSHNAERQMIAAGCKFYKPTKEEEKLWVDQAKSLWDQWIKDLKLDRDFIKRIQDQQIPLEKY